MGHQRSLNNHFKAKERTSADLADKRTPNVHDSWTTGFLTSAQECMREYPASQQPTMEVESPAPLGIVTHSNIINVLLQSSNADKDFFKRRYSAFTSTQEVLVHESPGSVAQNECRKANSQAQSIYNDGDDYALEHTSSDGGTLHRRNVSSKADDTFKRSYGGLDGANDRGIRPLVGMELRHRQLLKQNVASRQSEYSRSSYTDNSRGGFHTAADDSKSFVTDVGLHGCSNVVCSSPVTGNSLGKATSTVISARTVSMPNHPAVSGKGTMPLRKFTGGSPRLPNVRRVTPFSRESSLEPDNKEDWGMTVGKLRARRIPSYKENYCSSTELTISHSCK